VSKRRLTDRCGAVRASCRAVFVSTAALVFVGSLVFRFLNPGFHNDDFFHIAVARQILYGDVPVRDFFDHWGVLRYYLSAAVMALSRESLLGEVLLSLSLLACAATLTFVLATRAARSLPIGLGAMLLAVAMLPRQYSYFKVFMAVLAIYLLWRYVDDPRTLNLVLVALCTLVAFWLRFDVGLQVGLTAVLILVAIHWRDGPRHLFARLTLFGAVMAVGLTPAIAFLAQHDGVLDHARSVGRFTQREAERTGSPLPTFAIDPAALHPPAQPAGRTSVYVRWAPDVEPAERRQLEERHGLASPVLHDGDSNGRS
jgi:hypothetical protein